MYRHTLIINKRHEMPRSKIWLWDGVTLLLWVGFIYLWHPVFHIFLRIINADVPAEEISDWIYDNIHSVTFENGLKMLIVTPIVLFLLSWLKRHKGPSEHVIYTDEDYAGYFRLDADRLQTYRDSQLVTVHHDDRGQITALEDRID
ncbi:MAG: poly-beta-1,6-N-acetyl-D-glucosamine biosynthesis protein PgaD [Pseudomonadota bacterium]